MRSIQDITARYQLLQTKHLIDVEGRDIALTRPAALVSDGAGSMHRSGNDTQLPPVRRALLGLTMVGRGVNQQPERWHVTNLGERQKIVFVMIGLPDDDVQENDYWMDGNNRYSVAFVHLDRSYQTKAEILLMGGSG